MKLLEKLNAIMGEAGYVQKTGKHPQFKYASEYDIKVALHPLLVKHKVLLVPKGFSDVQVAQLPKEIEETKNGVIKTTRTVSVLTTFVISWEWLDCESGETLTVSTIGQGWDSGDKGCNKGETAALKYAITLTLLIVTGEDAEADVAADEPKTSTSAKPQQSATPPPPQHECKATQEQIDSLEKAIRESGHAEKIAATITKLKACKTAQEATDYYDSVLKKIAEAK